MTSIIHKLISLAITTTLSSGCTAQEIAVEGTIQGKDLHSSLLLITPMGSNRNDTLHLQETDAEKHLFRINGTLQPSADSLYCLMGVVEGKQLLQPLRIIPGEELHLWIEGNCVNCNTSTDNTVLCAFNKAHMNISRKLWEEGKEMSSAELEQLLGGYKKEIMTLTKNSSCSSTVRQYLYLWAYTLMKSQYNSLSFITKKQDIQQQIPEDSEVLWSDGMGKKPQLVLDNAMALYFYQTPQIIAHDLPAGTVDEKIKALYDRYRCQPVRKRVADLLLEDYIMRFDYVNHFDEGFAIINNLTQTYELDKRYLQQFTIRRYSTPGSLFPKEVTLVDSFGKRLDFSSFHGKYVYVDFWASWCKPCINEIPYLQQLEKEMSKRDDIVFVSISIDQNKTAWKNKMKELNLHGYQLHDENAKLGKYLNINTIPHFIIYDKEGRLLQYNAARPSSVDKLRTYLEQLP